VHPEGMVTLVLDVGTVFPDQLDAVPQSVEVPPDHVLSVPD